MTTWLKRATIALVFMCVTPGTASAQFWDVIKWLNDMSGPQMIGTALEWPVWCRYENDDVRWIKCPPVVGTDHRNFTLGPRVGWANNTHEFGNEPTVRKTTIRLFGAAARWSPKLVPAIDLTSSFEMVQFRGPTVTDFWVPTADGGIVVRPILLWKPVTREGHILTVSWRYKKFFEKFDGGRFGAPGTFTSNYEGISQFTVGLDFSPLFFK